VDFLRHIDIGRIAIQFAVLLFSLSIHEAAHAWMADRFGDYTARYLGRVTINPIPHIDPIGTILFPLLQFFTPFPLIGWAKPVPVNAARLRDPRRDQIFIPVNCGAIPRDLVESEFFGHAKGAFTGALQDKKGYFEMAHGGTIFLDEVGDAPPELQVKLLRVIQESEIMPIGYHQPRRVDVRIIASTNRDLKAEVAAGHFRQDLYFRINVFSVTIPPLRERPQDILPLTEFFIRKFSARANRRPPRLGAETRKLLLAYPWPGNVRELQNEIERVVLVAEPDGEVGPELLSEHVWRRSRSAVRQHRNLRGAIQALEEEMIQATLDRLGGNRSKTAKALGISRQSLLDKLKRMGVAES